MQWNRLRSRLKYIFYSLGGILGAVFFYPQMTAEFELLYQENEFNRYLIENSPSIKSKHFYPTFYLGYGILQAFYGSQDRFANPIHLDAVEALEIKDEGVFYLRWYYANKGKRSKSVIVTIPGLTASVDEPYLINMIYAANQEGFDVVVYSDRLYNEREHLSIPKQNSSNLSVPNQNATNLNITSQSGTAFGTKKYICVINDFKISMEMFQERYGHVYESIYGVGHSFGANILARYLGEYNQQTIFKAAVFVSNPWDMLRASRFLQGAFDGYIVNSRIQILKQKQHLFDEEIQQMFNINLTEVLQSSSSQQFDEVFTKKIFGVERIEQFFERISSVHTVKNIQVPFLSIQSKDDPILHHFTIPYNDLKQNPNSVLIVTNTGGHVGWYQNTFSPRRWYMQPTLDYLKSINQLTQQSK